MTNKKNHSSLGLLFNALLVLNLAACAIILIVLQPLWFDINKFLIAFIRIEFHWVNVVLFFTLVLLAFFTIMGVRQYKDKLSQSDRSAKSALMLFTFILWNAMFGVLLSELQEEKRLLINGLLDILPTLFVIILAIFLLFVLPNIKRCDSWKTKALIFVIAVITPLIYINIPDRFAVLSGPYLQGAQENSMTIMWITNNESRGYVEFGEQSANEQTRFSSSHGLVDVGRIHKIKIDNLKPATQYKYRIVTEEVADFMPYNVNYGDTITSEEFTFNTVDKAAEKVSFLIFNDVHENANTVADLLKTTNTTDYDYVFYNGDIISHIDDENQIRDALLDPSIKSFAHEKPFVLVRGNHETRGAFSRDLPKYISSKEEKYYFSMIIGEVFILVMDSGEDKKDSDVEYSGLADFDSYRTEQTQWLETQIQREDFKKAKFRIALMHMPIYGAPDQQDGVDDAAEKWGPLFNQGKLDILLAGHTHAFDVIEPNAPLHQYPIVIGGGNNPGERTVMQVKAEGELLQVLMIRDDGETVADYQLTTKKN